MALRGSWSGERRGDWGRRGAGGVVEMVDRPSALAWLQVFLSNTKLK